MEACKSEIYSETYPLLLLNRIKRCWRSSLHLIKCRYKLELNSQTSLLFHLFFLLMFWLCYLSVIKKFYDVKSVMMWVFYACACSHTLICSQTLTLDHFLSCFFLNLIFVFLLLLLLLKLELTDLAWLPNQKVPSIHPSVALYWWD